MKVLFIVPYPLGVAASQRFRVEQLLPVLSEADIEFQIASFWDVKTWQILYQRGHIFQKGWGMLKGFMNRIILLATLPAYDYLVVHREATPVGPPWFEWLATHVFKKKVIFDIDDAIWLPNITDTNTIAARFKQHHKVNKIMQWSYRVSCGNRFLLNYALKFNLDVVVLPTIVDTSGYYKHLKQQLTNKVTIGWTGSHSTLPSLNIIEPVIGRLEQEFDFDFVVIADKKPELNIRSLVFIPWQKNTEIEDLLKLNIGVMPLPLTEWSEGKCAFKAIQYMALGIPAVVAAVGANLDAVPDGVASFICHSEQDWYVHLKQLLLNAELRAGMGKEGKLWVQQYYSVDAHKGAFLKLFT